MMPTLKTWPIPFALSIGSPALSRAFHSIREPRDSVTMETMPWYVRFTVAQQRSESENARKARTLGKLGWRPSERTDAGQMPCPKARKARLALLTW